jgi:glycosyltransferase involved in cell wall biosynthesis
LKVGIALHGPGGQPTGVPRASIELLHALTQLPDGPELYLLGDESLGNFDLSSARLTRLPMPSTAGAVARTASKASVRLSHLTIVAAWLPRVAHRYGLDIVHDLTGLAPFPRRMKRTKSVATLHDLVSYRPQSTNDFVDDFIQRRWLPLALKHVDGVVTVSETVADEARSIFGLEDTPVVAVHHGVDHAVPSRCEPGDPRPPSAGYLLAVGVTSERKNVPTLISALSGDWRNGALPPLLLAGPRGRVVERCLETAAQLGVADFVRCVGYLSDAALAAHYQQALALVYPSLDEGFGLPILEAMAHGTPVITSDRGATREIAADAAVLVNPTDEESIRSAVTRVVNDEALRRDLAGRGRARASKFTWAESARRLEHLYDQLAAS